MIHDYVNLREYLQGSPFSSDDLYRFLLSRKIGIFQILTYKKARQWPYYNIPFKKEILNDFPILWSFICVDSNKKISLFFEIHPMKCFPLLYSTNNRNHQIYPISIEQRQGYTIAGCLREVVTISGKQYDAAKQHDYCSALGLPDDCYDEQINENWFEFLKSKKEYEIWCFEKCNFLQKNIPDSFSIRYMKDEFLPSKNFFHKDTAAKILSGLFRSKDLISINENYWYQNGKNFIKERNYLNSGDLFRFEETSLDIIKRKIIFEFIRKIILLKNKDQFKLFCSTRIPKFNEIEKISADKKIEEISDYVKNENLITLNSLIHSIKPHLNQTKLRTSHLLVMDMEFVTVIYPTKRILKEKRSNIERRGHKDPRSLKFPCIVVSIIWDGRTKKMDIVINTFTLPCHYCKENCREMKSHSIRYHCQNFADSFISKQISFFEEMLAEHESLKIFSYGKSDLNQLEYGDNFFNNSYDFRVFKRKNRKNAKRIVDIAKDISEPNVKLHEIERDILEKWIIGWSRKQTHANVNRNFTTRITKKESEQKYKDAIETCVLDSISTFLYLLYKNFRKTDDPIRWERSVQGTLQF